MALGTPTFLGQANRDSYTSADVTVSCSSSSGDYIIVAAMFNSSSAVPSAVTGHGCTFLQIGTTEAFSSFCDLSIWAGFSTGATSQNIVASYGTNVSFGIQVIKISGTVGSGDVTAPIVQRKQYNETAGSTTLTEALTSAPTKTVLHFWAANVGGSATIVDNENVLGTQVFLFGQRRQSCGWGTAQTVTATGSVTSIQHIGHHIEITDPVSGAFLKHPGGSGGFQLLNGGMNG